MVGCVAEPDNSRILFDTFENEYKLEREFIDASFRLYKKLRDEEHKQDVENLLTKANSVGQAERSPERVAKTLVKLRRILLFEDPDISELNRGVDKAEKDAKAAAKAAAKAEKQALAARATRETGAVAEEGSSSREFTKSEKSAYEFVGRRDSNQSVPDRYTEVEDEADDEPPKRSLWKRLKHKFIKRRGNKYSG